MSVREHAAGAAMARPFGLGPLRVELTSRDAIVVARFEVLFGAMPDPPPTPTETVEVGIATAGPGRYDLEIRGRLRLQGLDVHELETAVASRLNRLLLDHEGGRLHLHAGAVAAPGDRGVLLIGSTGSGKSTLTAHLARSGWTYLTDEMVALDADPLAFCPYPRPITLKPGSWSLFPELPEVTAAIGSDRPPSRLEIPPASLAASVADRPVRPALIVSVQPSLGEPTIGPLAAPAALRALVDDTLDLERAAVEGMQVAAQLAADVPAVRLTTGDLARCEELVAGALESAEPRAAPLRYLPPQPSRSPVAHAWDLGTEGTGAIYDLESGVLLTVDAGGLAIWDALGRTRDTNEIVEAVGAPPEAAPSIEEFIGTLEEHGLLKRGAVT